MKYEIIEDYFEMVPNFRKSITVHGYDVSLIKSALQKYIRRSMNDESSYCATELYLFNYIDNGKSIFTNLIHRLMVIVFEDCGPAMFDILHHFNALFTELLNMKSFNEKDSYEEDLIDDPNFTILLKIVYLLSNSKHSRELSHINAISDYNLVKDLIIDDYSKNVLNLFFKKYQYEDITEELKLELSEIIELIIIKNINVFSVLRKFVEKYHIKKFKSKITRKTKIEYFIFNIINFIANETIKSRIEKDKFNEIYNNCLYFFEHIKNLRESWLTYGILIHYLFYDHDKISVNGSLIQDFNKKDFQKFKIETIDNFFVNNIKNVSRMIIDEFCYDKHAGFHSINNFSKFAIEGALVNNEWEFTNEDFKKTYISKYIERDLHASDISFFKSTDEIPFPTNIEKENQLQFIIRCQLVTGYSRCDTYIAKWNNHYYCVKGPFIKCDNLGETIKIQDYKKNVLGIGVVEQKIYHLFPNSEIVSGLGSRNYIKDFSKKYCFLISKLLFKPKNIIPFEIRSSKKWSETKVVNWKKVSELTKNKNLEYIIDQDDVIELLNDHETRISFLESFTFRALFKNSDNAFRNFIFLRSNYGNNVILGLDEDNFTFTSLIDLNNIDSFFITMLHDHFLSKFMRNSDKKIVKEILEKWYLRTKNLDDYISKTIKMILGK